MSKHLKMNLQLFAEADDEDDIEGEELEGEVIGDEQDVSDDGASHSNRSRGVGLHQALDKEYWQQFLALQKMQNEKVNHHLEALVSKIDDLDARHQQVPAAIKAELEALFEAHKEAGNIADEAEQGKKLSKYARHK